MADFERAESAVFAACGLRPTVTRIHLNDPAITVRILEVGSGEPVVLLHGISLTALHWASIMAGLEPFRCIAIDMPGHGGSDAVDYTGVDLRDWHVKFLVNCLSALGLRSAHVIGHSYGGMFGLWLALAAAERTRSLVMIGAPAVAFGAKPDLTLSLMGRAVIGPGILRLPAPLVLYRTILAASLGSHAVRNAHPDLIRATYLSSRQRGFAQTVSSYLHEQFHGVNALRYRVPNSALASVKTPTLVLWGSEDRRYQSPDDGLRIADHIPNVRAQVVPGGHEPWLDDLQSVQNPLGDFLRAVRHSDSETSSR